MRPSLHRPIRLLQRPRAGLAALLLAGGVLSVPLVAPLAANPALAEEFRLLGTFELPSGLSVGGVPFGGLSAIEHHAEADVFYALSDDRAEFGPARFYALTLDLSEDGINGVDILGLTEIAQADGAAFPHRSLDPEALRLDGAGGFYWAHERDTEGRPFVGRMDADGRVTASFTLPDYYMPAEGAGVRPNLAFESLTVTPEGDVVAAVENALVQDGPAASITVGSPSRVLVLDPESGQPTGEYVYISDPVPARPQPGDGFATNGLVELLARPDGGFYALERAFSSGQGNTVKLYRTSFDGADNVLNGVAVDAAPMAKELLLTLQTGGVTERVDNLEGMSFGPEIGGARTLILVSDNNFNPNGQVTQFILLAIEP